ncbi:unnamed protein product [Rotaria sp. Silwood1]|nr:unnamed protein product [Rotaria sp. Silwood1]CAF3563661.1 unnamed protein product [Rotaria sp. Silwood1]CAF4892937.1 unnamed protein product [Rotaria sp. Silwood1]
MTTENESNLCSICNKSSAKCFCVGCKKYFCSKDFKEHEQQLSTKFDNEIVRSHDELLDQIQKLEKSNYSSLDFFDRIEQWKKTTIKKVEEAAEKARHKLIELIEKQRIKTIQQIEPITKEIRRRQEEENFIENDMDHLKQKLNEVQQKVENFFQKHIKRSVVIDNQNQIDWNQFIYVREEPPKSPLLYSSNLKTNAESIENPVIVAGGNGEGSEMNQLNCPWGLNVDDDQTIYIAEYNNHRIVRWKYGATAGRVVAGGNGEGNRPNQLRGPTNVIIDKQTDNLIICDYRNKRVVRWPRQNGTNGETIISNVGCLGSTMDDDGFLYIADFDKHEVRRYQMEDHQGVVVAGGNGPGNHLDQLNNPRYVFVDRNHSIYVSDYSNHRVMKWMNGAKQGIVVAGGQDQGNSLAQLSNPCGIVVDRSGTIYVADCSNHRIMRWSPGDTQGTVFVGESGQGSQMKQLSYPIGLSLDRDGNLYVSDQRNHRVQKFLVN